MRPFCLVAAGEKTYPSGGSGPGGIHEEEAGGPGQEEDGHRQVHIHVYGTGHRQVHIYGTGHRQVHI